METLFGLPMSWLSISLSSLLAVASLVVIGMGLRNRILLKLALRNIPRRRAQTILIVVGLMLSTTIISASLAIGDTTTGSIRGVVLDALGHTDLRLRTPIAGGDAESAVFEDDQDGTAFFVDRYLRQDVVTLVITLAEADERIDGVLPQIREVLPVLNARTELTESRMNVVGFDSGRQSGFGEIRSIDGELIPLDSIASDEVLVNEFAAEELDAAAGDPIEIVTATGRHAFTLKAVVRNNGLAANDNRTIMSLASMQRIMERDGQVNRIDLSARGGITGGLDLAEEAAEELRVRFTDPVVSQQLFDLLRSPDVINALSSYADDGGGGLLSGGDEDDLRSLIDELEPGETATAQRSAQIGAFLLALTDAEASEHLLVAIGDKLLAASPGGAGGGEAANPEQILGGLIGSNDGLMTAAPLVDALVEAGAGNALVDYVEISGAELPTETEAVLLAASRALSQQPVLPDTTEVAVTDRFRSLAADSSLAAHILVAIDSGETANNRGTALAATSLFAALQVLAVDELKGDSLEFAEFIGNIFMTFFTIFGTFSIIVGLLLIFLVFVMLAASRSTEMGIARAVGTKRRHLVQMFTYEGYAYALGAALIGTVLGILASIVLVQMLAGAIDDEEDPAFVFRYSFTVTSVATAFSAGMLLTLITVAISAYRVSRLNIVVAIRGLPEQFVPSDTPPLRRRFLKVAQAILGPFYLYYRSVSWRKPGEPRSVPAVLVLLAVSPLLVFGVNTITELLDNPGMLFLAWFVILAVIAWVRHRAEEVLAPILVVLVLLPPVYIWRIAFGVFRLFQPSLAMGWPLAIVGVGLAVLGLVLKWAAFWTLGVSLALVGVGLFIRRALHHGGARDAVADRVSYTFIGATILIFWSLPFDALEFITGELSGSIEMFILSGTWMVASAVWLVMYNADLITRGLESLFNGSPRARAILKPAVAYPMTAKFRTGLTVAMFSLVIFTMMVFAILNGIGSDLDQTPDRVTGGFDIRAETSLDLPVADMEADIRAASNLDISDFEVIARHTDIPAEARQVGAVEQRFLGLGVRGAEHTYLRETLLEITHFDPAYLPEGTPLDDPVAVSDGIWAALAEDPSLAVVSGDLLQTNDGGFQFGGAQFSVEGLSQDEPGPIESFEIELRQGRGRGAPATRTIIGAMDQFAEAFEFDGGPIANLVTRDDVFRDLSGSDLPFTTFRVRLKDGSDVGRIAAAMETAFLDNSMEATDTLEEIKTGISQNNAFNRLFQGFMGLGLVVGVASLGVLSFRAVVERRHSIGMMRAIGYKSRMIQFQFLLESVFVTVLGSLLGVGLGALISWNIINNISESVDDISYDIPWITVMTIVGIALVMSLLTTLIPARQASRIYPSEALRYE